MSKTRFNERILVKRILLMGSVECRKTGCRNWIKAANNEGRGYLQLDGQKHFVTRLAAWAWLNYDLDDKTKHILHRCDNPSCINFRHIYPGTQKQNVRDAFQRSRRIARRGSLNGRSKLRESDIAKIRLLRERGLSLNRISKLFSVSLHTIHRIDRKKGWTHV